MSTSTKSANNVRVRDLLEIDNTLWVVRKMNTVKPGKGGAFVQLELKELTGTRKNNTRLRSTEDVTIAEPDPPEFYTLLYVEGQNMVLMHEETYEQIEVDCDMVREGIAPFLSDGMRVRVAKYAGQPLLVSPWPPKATFTVTDGGHIREDTVATKSFKRVTLENGASVMVPPFVGEGDAIVVNLDTLEYEERASKA